MVVRKKKVVVEKPKMTCTKCNKEQAETNFYNSSSPMFNGRVTICKSCIKTMIDYDNMDSIYDLLRNMDMPYLQEVWSRCEGVKADTLGSYVRQMNSLPQYSKMRWSNSCFTSENIDFDNGVVVTKPLITKVNREMLTDKWGFGYSDEELYMFEKKYDLLKNNYPEKTAMHTESLLTYIRYRVKEEMATAKGDVAEATKWGNLADKASERAKLNPNQLSKADLSGGLNGFGELVRAVEQAVDVIEILPRFKKKPQDSIDWTLWCYINYIRRLKGLPDADYEDIYQFYEERKKEYEIKEKEDLEL